MPGQYASDRPFHLLLTELVPDNNLQVMLIKLYYANCPIVFSACTLTSDISFTDKRRRVSSYRG